MVMRGVESSGRHAPSSEWRLFWARSGWKSLCEFARRLGASPSAENAFGRIELTRSCYSSRAHAPTKPAVSPLSHGPGIMTTSALTTIASLLWIVLPFRMGTRRPKPTLPRFELGCRFAGLPQTYFRTRNLRDSRQRRGTGPFRLLPWRGRITVLRPPFHPSCAFFLTHRMEPLVPHYSEANSHVQ